MIFPSQIIRQQTKWTVEERDQLSKLVALHTVNNRTNWKDITTVLLKRTPDQCKTQYRIVIKEKQSKNVNFVWKQSDVCYLFMLVQYYGAKWKFIQQNYYPHLKSAQIRQKFNSLKNYYEELDSIIKVVIDLQEDDFPHVSSHDLNLMLKRYQFFQCGDTNCLYLKKDPLYTVMSKKMISLHHMSCPQFGAKLLKILQQNNIL